MTRLIAGFGRSSEVWYLATDERGEAPMERKDCAYGRSSAAHSVRSRSCHRSALPTKRSAGIIGFIYDLHETSIATGTACFRSLRSFAGTILIAKVARVGLAGVYCEPSARPHGFVPHGSVRTMSSVYCCQAARVSKPIWRSIASPSQACLADTPALLLF